MQQSVEDPCHCCICERAFDIVGRDNQLDFLQLLTLLTDEAFDQLDKQSVIDQLNQQST